MTDEVLGKLRLLVGEVCVGTNAGGLLCPICSGGRSGERTLSIRRLASGDALYKCHRASCGAHGRVFVATGAVAAGPAPSKRPPRVFSGEVRPLGAGWVSELSDLYGISENQAAGFGWCEEAAQGRLVVPVRGPFGLERGVELRARKSHGSWSGPKTDHYRHSDEVWMGWYRPADRTDGPVVLVEDCISAAKVCLAGTQAASLMGSHLCFDRLGEVLEVSDSIVLALDKDASAKALAFKRRFGFLAGNFSVLLLSKDLKYENIETIQKMVKEVE